MAPARPLAAARVVGDGGEQGFRGSLWSPPSYDDSPRAAATTTRASTSFIDDASLLAFFFASRALWRLAAGLLANIYDTSSYLGIVFFFWYTHDARRYVITAAGKIDCFEIGKFYNRCFMNSTLRRKCSTRSRTSHDFSRRSRSTGSQVRRKTLDM